jgi:hypothetical protein
MNEQIKVLVKESNLDVYGLGKDREKWEYTLSKFAELMINDCIKELEISRRCDPYTGNLYDCEYNTCIKEQIEVLKARFGVKE